MPTRTVGKCLRAPILLLVWTGLKGGERRRHQLYRVRVGGGGDTEKGGTHCEQDIGKGGASSDSVGAGGGEE